MTKKKKRKSISLHKLFMLAAEIYVHECSQRGVVLSCCTRLTGIVQRVLCKESDSAMFDVALLLSGRFDHLYRNYGKYFPRYWPHTAYEERVFALLLAAKFYKGKRIYYYN